MKEVVLKLARAAIGESLGLQQNLSLDTILKENPWLEEDGAVFVTLSINGNLRGCIGSLSAHRKLYEDIIYNARSAAFNDPRFNSLSKEEFEYIRIEVSILSKTKQLTYGSIEDLKSKIKIGIDGVVLQASGRQATFLPQVWDQLPTFELFFSNLCQKAGLVGNCLDMHPEISIYQVAKYEE
ncbi:MAG: AmmeMemoRadiSam system protein A [Sulfurospirillaceae bacterium]|nr:AmmeMemoRadiSam system protein A [Sulfurospirillaceae bacterium]